MKMFTKPSHFSHVPGMVNFPNFEHCSHAPEHKITKDIPQITRKGKICMSFRNLFYFSAVGILLCVGFCCNKTQPCYVCNAVYLTHWPLADVAIILKAQSQSPNTCYRLSYWALLVKLLSGECHWTPLMISQHYFSLWLYAVRQRAITRANVDPVLCCHMVSKWLQWVK